MEEEEGEKHRAMLRRDSGRLPLSGAAPSGGRESRARSRSGRVLNVAARLPQHFGRMPILWSGTGAAAATPCSEYLWPPKYLS